MKTVKILFPSGLNIVSTLKLWSVCIEFGICIALSQRFDKS